MQKITVRNSGTVTLKRIIDERDGALCIMKPGGTFHLI